MLINKALTQLLAAFAFVVACLGAPVSQAATINLFDVGFVQYGDAQSYSLPIANISVQSSPGQIDNLIVVATGANGMPVNTNFAGMDNAYQMPNGVSGSNFFRTGGQAGGYPGPDPSQVSSFFGDLTNRWDSTLAALKTFLAGDQMVVFFNNNQINANPASQQSLAAWARITVTNNVGAVIGTYDLTNNLGQYNLVSMGGGGTFLGDVATYNALVNGAADPRYNALTGGTDYVLSGGQICVMPGPIPVPVPCGTPGASAPINHNLGANEAAYAIVFPELNAQLASLFANDALDLTQYTLHADIRMGCDPTLFGTDSESVICAGGEYGKNLNNGFEQIFIGTATNTRITNVPEPASLALLALGLAGLGFSRRMKA